MKSRAKVGALAAVVLMAPALGFLAASPAGAAAAAPVVTAVSPGLRHPRSRRARPRPRLPVGPTVTITGSNFTGATAVHFGTARGHRGHRRLRHDDHGNLADHHQLDRQHG